MSLKCYNCPIILFFKYLSDKLHFFPSVFMPWIKEITLLACSDRLFCDVPLIKLQKKDFNLYEQGLF